MPEEGEVVSNHLHPDWEAEKGLTKDRPKWKEELLSRIGVILGEWGSWATRVGFKTNETQIRFDKPIDSLFSYSPLDVLWVRFNTWNPQTKRPATRAVRFGPDTATLMVLVKVSEGNSFKWYLLARRKYQFAGKDLFTEFSRGWIKGAKNNDQGWRLFDRDFPGLKENPLVVSIKEQQMGTPVWEDNAGNANKTTKHLIVVEMRPGASKDQIEQILVDAKLRQEYGDSYPEDIGEDDLVSRPVVIELSEAAKLLNAHVLNQEGAKPALFGEEFSLACWERFLCLCGKQFPYLVPDSSGLI
ncbi:MAG: hypothetical protein NTZ07_01895 [Candidatus Woesebacteria bacterium]|nr:hypothetical protein [Candidatus Woesebacteria bacterium]